MTIDVVALINSYRAVRTEHILNFTKQLYFLLNSGIPLYRAIQIVLTQTTDPKLIKVLHSFLQNLSEGKTLTDCVTQYKESFSDFYISMIAVGESRGELEEALRRTYLYLESAKELREKIINSLTYPIILLTSGIVVLTLMIVFVLPKFAEIFMNASIVLPLPTRILLWINRVISTQYPWLIVLLILSAVGVTLIRHDKVLRYHADKQLLHLPIVGKLFMTIYISRFCRTLGVLYNSGVQLLPAIELSKASLTNKILEQEIDNMIISVRDGKGLSKPLSESHIFPQMMTQMIAVGEESGSLEKVLLDVAAYYEQETDFRVKRMMALVEPLALIVISLFVMLIASSVMLPLFRMSSAIRSF